MHYEKFKTNHELKKTQHIFIFLLLLITSDLYSQVHDTIIKGEFNFPDTINQVDKNGLKQGYWFNYEKSLKYSVHSDFGENSGYEECNHYTLVSEGNYRSNKKVGLWKYYRTLNLKVLGLEKTVTYMENGSFIENNEYKNYKLEVNSDSTYMKGEYYLKSDTVFINCVEDRCEFKLGNDLVIDNFTKSEFDLNFYGLLIGNYTRKIIELKNK
jgi:hypothetical protein